MMEKESLISEAITPVAGSSDTAGMARGEPGLPKRFRWRGTEYTVAHVIETWKTSGRCHHGSEEKYLRRHWWKVITEPAATMTLYCLRQPMRGKNSKSRWFLYSITEEGA